MTHSFGLPDFSDKHFAVGDHVKVEGSGRTGMVARRCKNPRDGWIVEWDVPMYGATEGRVATVNLVHASESERA